jgi:hypothetical protein
MLVMCLGLHFCLSVLQAIPANSGPQSILYFARPSTCTNYLLLGNRGTLDTYEVDSFLMPDNSELTVQDLRVMPFYITL